MSIVFMENFVVYQDPFRLKMATGPPGTLEKPTEVPTAFGERIVGCVCKYCIIVYKTGALQI